MFQENRALWETALVEVIPTLFQCKCVHFTHPCIWSEPVKELTTTAITFLTWEDGEQSYSQGDVPGCDSSLEATGFLLQKASAIDCLACCFLLLPLPKHVLISSNWLPFSCAQHSHVHSTSQNVQLPLADTQHRQLQFSALNFEMVL